MSEKIQKLLCDEGGNYIFPFFWQHGEDEKTLREYMKVINESHLQAVCIESRPHPDFCGPKWWRDMDIILDEARKRGMKVWILDDSHFPTGYANGAIENQPQSLRRQSIACTRFTVEAGETLMLDQTQIRHPKPFEKNRIEQYIFQGEEPVFDDDRLISLYAYRIDSEDRINLKPLIHEDMLCFRPKEGSWEVLAVHASRNFGPHRSYINMMDSASCRVLIDAVYEPHYAHYASDFGKTIAGFFSDEPELGNGHLYDYGDSFGTDVDFPWSAELEARMQKTLGPDYEALLPLLWRSDGSLAPGKVRYQYMNEVTHLVQMDFSKQVGEWCRTHGVQYIGHLIEDDNHHSRTGCSLGHYFRALSGQDMAGIDDIGRQVFPQGEDISYNHGIFQSRNGEFYHYTMGKLASSAASIEPAKHGRAMCEIFGNYGWSEGVRLEKYLADHFMVRGVNHFVPHAFDPAPYPDPDCPPHFYAHGHHPQYRHFGALMAYMNRICELISDGRHVAQAAVIYSAEGDWTAAHGSEDAGYMNCDPVIRALYDAQIDCDILPQDVYEERDIYRTEIRHGVLKVNTQAYQMVFVPQTRFVTKAFAEAVLEMTQAGIPVYFTIKAPEGLCDTEIGHDDPTLMEAVKQAAPALTLDEVREKALNAGLETIQITPACDRVRCMHYVHEDGTHLYYFVNEGAQVYKGRAILEGDAVYAYDAWNNVVYDPDYKDGILKLHLEPLKSLMVVVDPDPVEIPSGANADDLLRQAATCGENVKLTGSWTRSICEALEYPSFKDGKEVFLPDHLEEEAPLFSGFVRYENQFEASASDKLLLEISDAAEGVEVFVNGESLGIQIVPVYRYDLSGHLRDGINDLCIEVATTLERERSVEPNRFGQKQEPSSHSGITGEVHLVKVQ